MFSCEFCEISKKTFSTEHLWATASIFDWRCDITLWLRSLEVKKNISEFS